MSMDKFFTREKSNEGIKLPLPLPNGLPSGDHLTIVGKYSDLYRENEADMKRRAVEVCSKYPDDKKKRSDHLHKLEIEFLASLVTGWSFDVEFNKKNIETLLREAPQIMDLIDRSVVNNSLFFGESSTTSSEPAGNTSSLKESQKAQKSQSGSTSNK